MMGHPVFIKWGYWRALSHYRCHNHCRGLDNNDDFLRRLCEVEKQDWEHARSIIFDNDKFFTLDENGLWHQKRAEEDWIEDNEKLQNNILRSQKALRARWGKRKSK